MNNKVYTIGDLHLGHKKLAEVRGFKSIEDHDQEVIRRWNSIVNKKDVVYVLGDVFKLDLVPQLNGTKKLALGNHDQRATQAYIPLFSQIKAYYEWDNCLLSHIPIHPNQSNRYRLNIHAHMHSYIINDPFYKCVSWEQVSGYPVELREISNVLS